VNRRAVFLDRDGVLVETLVREGRAFAALTTAGSNCGVIPTAIARANNTESITGRRNNRFVTTMSTVSVSATHSSR